MVGGCFFACDPPTVRDDEMSSPFFYPYRVPTRTRKTFDGPSKRVPIRWDYGNAVSEFLAIGSSKLPNDRAIDPPNVSIPLPSTQKGTLD
jgi:hypothetical protein